MLDTLTGSTDIPSARTNRNVAYIIRNHGSPMVYVGSTGYPGSRVSQHRGNLKRGEHDNKNLQQVYNVSPDINFVFYEVGSREDAYKLEKALIDYFKPQGILLNIDLDPVNHTKSVDQLVAFRKGTVNYIEQCSKKIMVEGIQYKSLRDAGRQLEIARREIVRRINSDKPRFSEWYFLEDGPKTIFGSDRPGNAVLVTVGGGEYTCCKLSTRPGWL